jgi:anti-sigma regulatory factor (Ser/Thr protein kinase)
MILRAETTLPVAGPADVKRAEMAARAMALRLAFDVAGSEDIALVATELASNVVKHGSGGTLILTPVEADGRTGLCIEARDNGPGIADFESAMADGHSTGGGLGCGLGTVNRLMDDVELGSLPGRGAQVICRRWLRPRCPEPTCPGLQFGVAARVHPASSVNGDTFVCRQWGNSALVGVIDGLGHGEHACRAAQAARQYVESHFDQPLDALFLGAGRACLATRGVVMALAQFDLIARRVVLAGVGNIEARLLDRGDQQRFASRPGIVGVPGSRPLIAEYPWSASGALVLHSDGVSTHWRGSDFPELAAEPASIISQLLMRRSAKRDDDATVVVVRNRI